MLQRDNHMKQENTFRGHLETRQNFQVWNWLTLCISGKMLSTRALCALIGLLSHADTAPDLQRKLPGNPLASSSGTRMEPAPESGSGRSSRSPDLEEHEQGHRTGQKYVVKWQRLQGREKKSETEGGQDKGGEKDLSGNKEAESGADALSWNRRWGVLFDNRPEVQALVNWYLKWTFMSTCPSFQISFWVDLLIRVLWKSATWWNTHTDNTHTHTHTFSLTGPCE